MKKVNKAIVYLAVFFCFLAAVLATTYYGLYVAASNSVQNPTNVLDTDYDYATLQYTTNITCPLGNFVRDPSYPTIFCKHNTTGYQISGWEVISFNSTGYNITEINVTGSELNLGCTSCGLATVVRVFKAGATYNSGTVWTYVGDCTYPDNSNFTSCILSTSGTNTGHILIARWQAGDFRPDPAVHLVTIGN